MLYAPSVLKKVTVVTVNPDEYKSVEIVVYYSCVSGSVECCWVNCCVAHLTNIY